MSKLDIRISLHPSWQKEKTDLSVCYSCKETIYGKLWRLYISECPIERFNGATDLCICDSCHWLVIGD